MIELTLVVNKHGAKKVIRMRFDWCQGKERNPMCSLTGGKIWGYPPATGPEQSQFSAFCVYSAEGGARRTQPSSFGSTHTLTLVPNLWHHAPWKQHTWGW